MLSLFIKIRVPAWKTKGNINISCNFIDVMVPQKELRKVKF